MNLINHLSHPKGIIPGEFPNICFVYLVMSCTVSLLHVVMSCTVSGTVSLLHVVMSCTVSLLHVVMSCTVSGTVSLLHDGDGTNH